MNLPRHCPRRNLGAIHPHQQILTLHTDESDKYHRIIHICVKQIRDNIQTRPRGLPPAPLSVRSNVDTSTPGQHSCVLPSSFSLPPSLAHTLSLRVLSHSHPGRRVCSSLREPTRMHTLTCARAYTHTLWRGPWVDSCARMRSSTRMASPKRTTITPPVCGMGENTCGCIHTCSNADIHT